MYHPSLSRVFKTAVRVKHMARLINCMKPPNILIYASDKEVFHKCRTLFESVLEPDCYALYQLDGLTFRSSKAWLNNTALLVLASQWPGKDLEQSLQSYLTNGGRCLSLYPVVPNWLKGTKENDVVKYVSDKGLLISPVDNVDFAQILPPILEQYFQIKPVIHFQKPLVESQQTTGYLIAEPYHQEAFFRNFGKQSADSMTLQLTTKSFTKNSQQEQSIKIHTSIIPKFNSRDYFNLLKTKVLGRTCLYFDIIASTHSVLEGCNSFPDGLVVIARRQTQGRGRSGNVWMSPEGCAMFSMRICFLLQSELGQHLSLLQHIVALAIVVAVKNLPLCHDLKLGVKWPNDIYYQDSTSGNNVKIGGVLVTTSIMGSQVITAVGCGINLNNQRPTLCLSELIRQAGENHPLSLEHFLALVANQLEELLDLVSSRKLNQVLALYHQHWLHSGAEVTVRSAADDEVLSAKIIGIDEFGFLRVQPLQGPSIVVHPDGNSFDMLSGLVSPKIAR